MTLLHLSKGSSASFGSPKLHSARLRSWGEVAEEVEATMEEVVMALSNAGTLGQVCSLQINLVRVIMLCLLQFKDF